MDQITLKDGRTFRVEFNWNALIAFLDSAGRDDVSSLAGLTTIKPSEFTGLLAAGINEGLRLDGAKERITPEEVGALSDLATMAEFIAIFSKQTTPKGAVPDGEKKE